MVGRAILLVDDVTIAFDPISSKKRIIQKNFFLFRTNSKAFLLVPNDGKDMSNQNCRSERF